jgi:hypothetical protein
MLMKGPAKKMSDVFALFSLNLLFTSSLARRLLLQKKKLRLLLEKKKLCNYLKKLTIWVAKEAGDARNKRGETARSIFSRTMRLTRRY